MRLFSIDGYMSVRAVAIIWILSLLSSAFVRGGYDALCDHVHRTLLLKYYYCMSARSLWTHRQKLTDGIKAAPLPHASLLLFPAIQSVDHHQRVPQAQASSEQHLRLQPRQRDSDRKGQKRRKSK